MIVYDLFTILYFFVRWSERSYIVLGSLGVDENYDVDDVLMTMLGAGCPAVLMILPFEVAVDVVHAAHYGDNFDTTNVLWVFSDYFITYDVYDYVENMYSSELNGALFLYPYQADNEVSRSFLEMWADLNPETYIDRNNDRTEISFFSSYIVDSVATLAGAYQLALEEGNYEDGTLLRERVFFNLVNNVDFEGLSGTKNFNSFGDLRHPVFNVHYVGNSNESVHIGNVTDAAVNIDLDSFSWLDGSQGVTSLYSQQLRPKCPPGEEPVYVANANLMTCTPCVVGTYKPHYGDSSCTACHEGMDCNDVGISVPCLLPGYWRPPEEAVEGLTYTVFRCDVTINCIGGCVFNESCAHGVDQTSPTCGVCAQGYAVSRNNECYDCTDEADYYYVIFVTTCSLFVCGIIVFLWCGIKDNSDKGSLDDKCDEKERSHDSSSGRTTSGNAPSPSIYSLQSLKPIRYISNLKVAEKIDLQAFTTNSITTFKLLLSFYLIMTQVVLNLDVYWPDKISNFFQFNIFQRPEFLSLSFCTSNGPGVYFDVMLFFFIMPMASLALLFVIGFVTFQCGIKRRVATNNKDDSWVELNKAVLRTNILRIILIFGLTIFPIVTSDFILYFDCRDFGAHGRYLRQDYSVDCDSAKYEAFVPLAICGIIVYGIGIPVCFYYVVSKRDVPTFSNSSIILHRSFKEKYKQFEIVALVHKVIMFSLVYFVATPGSSSQCLFLFLCNLAYYEIIAICQPYDFRTDTMLALSLTAIECFAILVAFLVISGVAEVEDYSMDDIYDILYSFLIFGVCILAPTLYAVKYAWMNEWFLSKTGIALNRVRRAATQSSHRLSALRFSFSSASAGSESCRNSADDTLGDDDKTVIRNSAIEFSHFSTTAEC
mmetsp:Transcript_8290/g.14047  ORF Transcript_8290/g.14047 Transcript_8290/m.14047 type:complete len:880 (-) Transcript_8290:196-2835(-)